MKKTGNPSNAKTGPALVRQANIENVLQLMRQADTFSKVDLARDSGISTTTMTKLFNQLEKAGLIEKDRIDHESFGRPRTLYRLAADKVCVLASVIDIDETTVAAYSLNGAVNKDSEVTFPTGRSLTGFYDRLAEAMRAARDSDGRKCLLTAVCLPGLIDRRSGNSVFCPNIHWLENTAPAKEIAQRLKLKARVLHEEKALSLIQQRKGLQDFLLMDFSGGVGAGVVCDGKLLNGHSGFAGEIGHITVEPDGQLCGCGNRGCLETVASDRAYFQALESTSKAKAVNNVLKYQAIGLAAAINLFNPQVIYLHTALSREVPDYLERIRKLAKARALAPAAAGCTIELAEAGKLQGTALHAIDRVLQATTA
ncbi:MAG: ROK family protein [Kiritimatiellales bacterium]|nr:ROK family protein [Kiritimatiellales bacterium]